MSWRAPIAAILAAAALAGAGCGSSDEGKPIPASIHSELDVQLEETQARLDNGSLGACQDITRETEPDVAKILERVPDDVNADVRDALNEGFARLFELVSQRCADLEGQQTDTEQQPTKETTPPELTTKETTPSETNTTPTETNTTPPETTPGNGNGGGGESEKGKGDDNGGVELPDGGGTIPPENP